MKMKKYLIFSLPNVHFDIYDRQVFHRSIILVYPRYGSLIGFFSTKTYSTYMKSCAGLEDCQ
ncbi:MAG: hypothetical protein QOE22_699 [Candidatus Parcubacteria bacterium]|nr:hypothetical protein [Candidatus Parcubacteria bacterium]